MTISLPGLNWKPGEVALAERLGREGRGRINHRMILGTSFLAAVEAEADYIALAWAHYADKVQMRAVRIAFAELYYRYPKEAD
jgi:hypothetical protein